MRTSLLGTCVSMTIAALGWAVGCGSNVTVGPDGAGAAGAAGSGSSTTVPSTSSTMGSSSTGDPKTICEAFCIAGEPGGCLGSFEECLQSCVSAYEQAGSCEPQLTDMLLCVTNTPSPSPGCDIPDSCQALVEEYGQCLNAGGCGPISCSGGGQECNCEETCNGTVFTAACKVDPSGTFSCDCMINFNSVGGCQETGTATPCDVVNGCCSQFFQP